MKIFSLALLLISVSFNLQAQSDPVTWTFTAKKIDEKTYEVHYTATMQRGWHLYSQVQPDDAIAIPTSFTINSNPLLATEGKIKEVGNLERYHDDRLDLTAHQYSGKVDFVQVVKLKAKVKTNLTGSVEYQTCDDKKCLPPKVLNFTISLH